MKTKFIISQLLIFAILFSNITSNNKTLQLDSSVADHALQDFIADTVPEGAKQIDNNVLINANKGAENISDKVEAKIYTFVSEKNVYTIVSFHSMGKLKTSKNDTLNITTNDYLLPLEAVAGKLYVKNKANDQWKFSRKLDAMPGLYGIELYGSQINNRASFIRILLCFRSEQNSEATNVLPKYVVNYNQGDTLTIPIMPIIIFSLLIIGIILFVFKRREHTL